MLPTIAAAIFLMAFSSSGKYKKPAKEYWIYVPCTFGYADTSKYVKVFLNSPGDQGCPTGGGRPCIFQEASGSLSTKAGLHTTLQGLGSDVNILAVSLRKKSC